MKPSEFAVDVFAIGITILAYVVAWACGCAFGPLFSWG